MGISTPFNEREKYGGETGIRTLDTLRYTRFPSVRLQPLGHLSARGGNAALHPTPPSARSLHFIPLPPPVALRNRSLVRMPSIHSGNLTMIQPHARRSRHP